MVHSFGVSGVIFSDRCVIFKDEDGSRVALRRKPADFFSRAWTVHVLDSYLCMYGLDSICHWECLKFVLHVT